MQMLNEYLAIKKAAWSPSTYHSTASRLKLFSNQEPQELYKSLVKRGYNRYYIKTVFVNISDFMDWRAEQGSSLINTYSLWLEENRHAFRNCYQDKYTSLTMEEFLDEYKKANGALKDALALLGFSGCRLGELHTFDGTSVVGKGGKRRRVYVPVTIDMDRLQNFSTHKIRRHLKYSPHSYRKLFADTVLRKGVDIKTVQTLLGHSSITTTQRYLRPMKEDELKGVLEDIYATQKG